MKEKHLTINVGEDNCRVVLGGEMLEKFIFYLFLFF